MNIRNINSIYTFGLLLMLNVSFAQDPYPCVNGISTDFNNPVNPNLPLLPDGSDGNTNYLNRFNWVNGNNPIGNYTYLTHGMFFNENEPYSNMLNVKPLIIPPDEFYQYLFFSPGFTPNNGWELLLFNLGYYPNTDDGTLGGSIVPHIYEEQKFLPYIILYNKYSGVLRIFVAYGKNQRPDTWINGVEIKLSFVGENDDEKIVSGLLRLGDGMDETLDQKTTSKELVAVAKNPGVMTKWYSADFQLAYDPCTCEYPSRLAITFEFFKTSNLRLVGNSLSSNDIPMTDVDELIANDFLGNFELTDTGNPENGYIIYKNLTKLMDDYLAQMTEYKTEYANYEQELKKYERNYAIVNMAKHVLLLGSGAQFAGPTGINLAAAAASGIEWATLVLDGAKDIKDSKDEVTYTKLSSETKKLIGVGFDWLMTEIMGDKPVPPNKPMPPSVSYSQMSFAGTIEDRSKIGAIDFPNPGTFDNSVPITDQYDIQGNLQHGFPLEYKYPLYNEVLGVFSLVENPKIEISYHFEGDNCFEMYSYGPHQIDDICGYHGDYSPLGNNGPTALFNHASTNRVVQFGLSDFLKFSFNPALNILDYDISASFEVYGEFSPLSTPYVFNPQGISNIPTGNITLDDHTSILNSPRLHANIVSNTSSSTTEHFPLDEPVVLNALDGSNLNKLSFSTPFLPIDAFVNSQYSFAVRNSFASPSIILDYASESSCYWLYAYLNSSYNNCEDLLSLIKSNAIKQFKIEDIYLRLLVNTRFPNSINPSNPFQYSYALKYKIDFDENSIQYDEALNPELVSSGANFMQYPEDLNLVDLGFDGSEIEGCKLNGSTYLCKSWNNIEISGDINIAQGYQVNVEAGNEIYVLPETELPHEMQLSIVPVLDFSTPNPPMSSEQINHFCKQSNNLYQANSLRAGKTIPTLEEIYSNFISDIQPDPTPIEFIVFPNPTTGASQAGLVLPELSTVSISIVDITGKVQGRPVRNQVLPMGRNVVNLESEPLAPGVYFVQLVVNGEKLTQRLVKQ